jgi:hypothetical protein
MSSLQAGAARPFASRPALANVVLPLFALTIFLSALLLFAIEPMFAKMALPLLGGSPSVWSVAMVFFQVLMLAGYSYAHALTRWLSMRVAAAVHLRRPCCSPGSPTPAIENQAILIFYTRPPISDRSSRCWPIPSSSNHSLACRPREAS